MSRIETVMDGVLAQLTDGIFTSATQIVGYRHHDAILQSSALPWVQAFAPIVTASAEPFQHATEELEFQLEILDVAGRNDVLRMALETLAVEMHKDNAYARTLGAERILIDVHDTFERAPVEISVAGCRVRAVFAELAVPSGADSGEVDVLDLVGNAAFCASDEDTITDSVIIPGGIGNQKVEIASRSDLTLTPSFPEYPLDLTGTNTLRVLYYARVDNPQDVQGGKGTNTVELQLLSGLGVISNWLVLEGHTGWTELVADLANPDGTSGGGADLSSITEVRLRRFYQGSSSVIHDEESWILKRIYYKASDTVAAITPTTEARTQDAMQAVLDHFADVVLGGIASTPLRGHLQPQHVTEALPFVMAYGGQTTMEEGPFDERPATLVFNLDVIDAPNRADELRVAFHQLAADLRADPTLAGGARRVRVSSRQVLERVAGETTQGRCEITVEWNDTTDGVKGTDVLAIPGNASFCDSITGMANITNSDVIQGGIGWAKDAFVSFGDFRMISFPEFPLDLSAAVTKRLRFLFYIRQNAARDFSQLEIRNIRIRLRDGSNVNNNYTPRTLLTAGWTEFNLDLQNPVAGSADLSDIVDIRLNMTFDNIFINHDDEAIILKRVYYTDRDTGSLHDGRTF